MDAGRERRTNWWKLASRDLKAAYGWAFAPCVERVEITCAAMRWRRRCPAFAAMPAMAALREADGPILFAHADLSGFSVFEEAAWWGIRAAERALA
jgi:hypothetical protein